MCSFPLWLNLKFLKMKNWLINLGSNCTERGRDFDESSTKQRGLIAILGRRKENVGRSLWEIKEYCLKNRRRKSILIIHQLELVYWLDLALTSFYMLFPFDDFRKENKGMWCNINKFPQYSVTMKTKVSVRVWHPLYMAISVVGDIYDKDIFLVFMYLNWLYKDITQNMNYTWKSEKNSLKISSQK